MSWEDYCYMHGFDPAQLSPAQKTAWQVRWQKDCGVVPMPAPAPTQIPAPVPEHPAMQPDTHTDQPHAAPMSADEHSVSPAPADHHE